MPGLCALSEWGATYPAPVLVTPKRKLRQMERHSHCRDGATEAGRSALPYKQLGHRARSKTLKTSADSQSHEAGSATQKPGASLSSSSALGVPKARHILGWPGDS